jgi:hypothetical protein
MSLRWQMDYWLVEDLLRAVDVANRTRDGLPTEVPRSPVKRIVSITAEALEMPEKPEDSGSDASAGSPGRDPFQPNTRGNLTGGMGMPSAGGGSEIRTHTGRKQRRQERRVPRPQRDVTWSRRATRSCVCSSRSATRTS